MRDLIEILRDEEYPCSLSLKERARLMRKNPTEAEAIIWNLLRNKQEDIKFRRQHIIGDYIVDFVDLKSGTIIEIDGGYHDEIEQIKNDNLRTERLISRGYSVLRFKNSEVVSNPEKVISQIIFYIGSKNDSGSGKR